MNVASTAAPELRVLHERRAGKRTYAFVECRCGKQWEVRKDELKSQFLCRSCSHSRHGHWRANKATRTYDAWRSMKKRCSDTKNASFSSHGGRGIKVCSRWEDSFEAFVEDMGKCPPNMTLDRFPNNDGDYTPQNCRWATCVEQAKNRRTNRWIEFNGERLILTDWARRLGVSDTCILQRLKKWPLKRALTAPSMRPR